MTSSPPGLDLAALREFLDANAPSLVSGALHAEVIAGGRSNLTYFLDDGSEQWVLRRPPLGHVMATAHNMAREYRVMAAMAGTTVPCPEVLLMCDDPDVIGAPFYIMERVDGEVIRTTDQSAALGVSGTARLSKNLVDVLASLHLIDPASIGLADFGRPEGFMSRQVARWGQQLESSRTREIPGIESLGHTLAREVPLPQRVSVVHGDYRLENVLATPEAEISAVLDWEMATLGDPLADLGLMCVYWDALPALGLNPVVEGIAPGLGYLRSDQLVERYLAATGLHDRDMPWYVAFSSYKLAVILEGIHYRYGLGLTVGERFEEIGPLVAPLIEYGADQMLRSSHR